MRTPQPENQNQGGAQDESPIQKSHAAPSVDLDATSRKRAVRGSWHKISAQHLSAYLKEMSFRFNRRNAEEIFLDTLRHMVTAPILTFQQLTAGQERAA
jgi:hypothetical protein